MKTLTKELQSKMTPQDALIRLKEGNERFVQNMKASRNLNEQVDQTKAGQFPFAAILSCIDSRVPAEIVFDQGIGDMFSARLAGNVVNEDVLGSLEYACKVAGSKLVVVLGHTKCGAVTAACNHVELGNITPLLAKIQPAVQELVKGEADAETIEAVAVRNVELMIDRIKNESEILNEMDQNNEIDIVGGIYDVATGAVTFL